MDRISDLILQKAHIISNRNQKPYLNLRVAAKKLEDEKYTESAEILERHLEKFPANIAAHLLLSKAYARMGKYHQAVQLLKSASESIHSPRTFDFYIKEIEATQQSTNPSFTNVSTNPIELKISGETVEGNFSQTNEANSYEHSLVSETLAKIYISQGEFKEAISIYEKLIERKPENKEKYLQSIEELKSRFEK